MTAPDNNLRPAIARIWRGRTTADKADEYALVFPKKNGAVVNVTRAISSLSIIS